MAKKGSGAGAAILIVGALAVLLLFSSTIIGFVSGVPQLIQDFIAQISGSINGLNGGNATGNVTGQAWMGYTVFYEDGSSKEVGAAPSFSLFPLSIAFEGKNVSSARVDLKAKLSSANTMGAWSAENLSMQTEIYKGSDVTPKTSSTANYMKSGASWSNGETKILASYTVQASQLEGLVATYGDGDWHLHFLGHFTLKMTVGGSQITLSPASATAGTMTFTYTNGVQNSLSVIGGCSKFSK